MSSWGSHRGPADMIGHCEMQPFRKRTRAEKIGKTDLLRGTKLRYRAVEHVEVVEEIDGWNDGRSCPLILAEASPEPNSPWTASHSLRSSPSGSFTARRRFPEPFGKSACGVEHRTFGNALGSLRRISLAGIAWYPRVHLCVA